MQVESVATPLLGTGVRGIPLADGALVLGEAVVEALIRAPSTSDSDKTVRVVTLDRDDATELTTVADALGEALSNGGGGLERTD